jgi:hypothetical protein
MLHLIPRSEWAVAKVNVAVVRERPVPAPKLLDQVRAAIRTRRSSRRTEKAYVGWIRIAGKSG